MDNRDIALTAYNDVVDGRPGTRDNKRTIVRFIRYTAADLLLSNLSFYFSNEYEVLSSHSYLRQV